METRMPEISRGSYKTELEAREVAEWLALKCRQELGGDWHPKWFQNMGWYADTLLGDPHVALIDVREHNGVLRYHGGFVSEPGRSSWKHGEAHHGNSPFEVMLKSYLAVTQKSRKARERLDLIETSGISVVELDL